MFLIIEEIQKKFSFFISFETSYTCILMLKKEVYWILLLNFFLKFFKPEFFSISRRTCINLFRKFPWVINMRVSSLSLTKIYKIFICNKKKTFKCKILEKFSHSHCSFIKFLFGFPMIFKIPSIFCYFFRIKIKPRVVLFHLSKKKSFFF